MSSNKTTTIPNIIDDNFRGITKGMKSVLVKTVSSIPINLSNLFSSSLLEIEKSQEEPLSWIIWRTPSSLRR